MADIINPYEEKRKESKGEKEVKYGGWLIMAFRMFKVPMPKKSDEAAVQRTGELLSRWFLRK